MAVTVRLSKPPKAKAKSLWILVRRLLLGRNRKPPPPPSASDEDGEEGEKSSLLSRSSLEQLLVMTDHCDDGDVVCRCAKKHGHQQVAALARPEAAAVAASPAGDADAHRGGAPPVHRRSMFGGFRRRLLMRRPWRPMLVAIPE